MKLKQDTTLTLNSEESTAIHNLLGCMSFNDYNRFVGPETTRVLKKLHKELAESKVFPKLFNPFEV